MELLTNLDPWALAGLAWLQPLVASHRRRSGGLFTWPCYLPGQMRNELGHVSPNWMRRASNLLSRCHRGHSTGPWRRGGPNVR